MIVPDTRTPLAPYPISTDKAAMAQITSSEELEVWLKDKPADWAQVIAARVALRVLPYAFGRRLPDEWVATYSLTMFRATAISWAARNFPARDMSYAVSAVRDALYTASAEAAYAVHTVGADTAAAAAARCVVYAAIGPATYASQSDSAAAPAIYASQSAARGVAYAAADSLNDSIAIAAARAAIWANISADCDWLGEYRSRAMASQQMTSVGLWLAGEVDGWRAAWGYATNRLLAIDASYQVWIDWCSLRFEGANDVVFKIPGDDHDRTEDKKILVRLADASNGDFWNKSVTYVNTTVQSWIDEARERVSGKSVTDTKIEIVEAPKSVASDRINFFISYATVDEAMAREVEAVLAELGYTSIAQFKDFKQSSFVRLMREGLAKSERFIALYSKAYWSSDHCQSEWDAAYARDPGAKRRKIVPFLLEAMDLRQQPLASEIVYEPLHGLSKDERKKAIKQMIEYHPNASLT